MGERAAEPGEPEPPGDGCGKPAAAASVPASLVCAACREGLVRSDLLVCWACHAPHHATCFEGRGGCARPRCAGRAGLVPPGLLGPTPGAGRDGDLTVAEPGPATLLAVVALMFPAVAGGLAVAAELGLPVALVLPAFLLVAFGLAAATVPTRKYRIDPASRRVLVASGLGPLGWLPFRPWLGFEEIGELQLRRFDDPWSFRLGLPVWDLWLVPCPAAGGAAPERRLLARYDGLGEGAVRSQAAALAKRLGVSLSLDPGLAAAALPAGPALAVRVECPVCGEDLPLVERVYCVACGGTQHRACWTWNQGCAVYGCGGRAFTPVPPGGAPDPARAGPAAVRTERPLAVPAGPVAGLALLALLAGGGGPGTLVLWAGLACLALLARRHAVERFVFVDRRSGIVAQRRLGPLALGAPRTLRPDPALARLLVLPEGEGPGARWSLAMVDAAGRLVPLGTVPADDPEAARPELEEVAARLGMVLVFHPPPGAWEALPGPVRDGIARLPGPLDGAGGPGSR